MPSDDGEKRINDKDDLYLDSNHGKLESSFAISLATIAESLLPQAGANGGISTGDSLRESSHIFRRLSRLPEDLEQSIPPNVSLPSLRSRGSFTMDKQARCEMFLVGVPARNARFSMESLLPRLERWCYFLG